LTTGINQRLRVHGAAHYKSQQERKLNKMCLVNSYAYAKKAKK